MSWYKAQTIAEFVCFWFEIDFSVHHQAEVLDSNSRNQTQSLKPRTSDQNHLNLKPPKIKRSELKSQVINLN